MATPELITSKNITSRVLITCVFLCLSSAAFDNWLFRGFRLFMASTSVAYIGIVNLPVSHGKLSLRFVPQTSRGQFSRNACMP